MAANALVMSSFLSTDANPFPNRNSSPALVSFNVAMQAPLKLTNTNYLFLRLQFITLLTEYDLLGFVDGSHACPPATIPNNGVSTANPTHNYWIRQDQLILNAIIGSLSHTLIPFIATASTLHATWTILVLKYGKLTRGRITQLKTSLSQCTKGSKLVTEFLQQVKIKIDELALMNAPVDIEDLTIKILHGLDDDYRELANTIQARDKPILFEELHEKLLNREAQITAKKSTSLSLPASANVAAKAPPPPRSNSRPMTTFSPNSSSLSGPWHPRPLQTTTVP